jgi:hypothetical protein
MVGRATSLFAGAQQEQPGIEPFTQQDRAGLAFALAFAVGWVEQALARSDTETIPAIARAATQQERRW